MSMTDAGSPADASPAVRVLIVGSGGLLGSALGREFTGRLPFTALPRTALDLLDPKAVLACLLRLRPAIVINTSAWSDVDGAEDHPEGALAINAQAVADLTRACDAAGASLVHFSTDFVFDGLASAPYRESDAPAPLGAYGRSKLAGEQAVLASPGAHLVLRVCWLYGEGGRNFFSQVGNWLQQERELKVVSDQVSVPNNVRVLAAAVRQMVEMMLAHDAAWLRARGGLYHLSASGQASRYDYARAVQARMGSAARATLVPVPASEFVMKAQRPAWSVLDASRLQAAFGIRLPAWQDCIDA
jgi:dTDP-4-dehydrorhamnose reductase